MPSYGKRGAELRESLVATAGRMQAAEQARIPTVLGEYADSRDAILTMMTVFLADDTNEPLAREYNSKLTDMSKAAQDKLDNMLSGLSSTSPAAVRFRERVDFEEMAFWSLLGSLKLGESRDALISNGSKVRELIATLDKKWKNLSEEDLRVEEAEQKAAKDLKDLLEQALAEAMPLYIQAGAGAIWLRDKWKSIPATITDHVKATLIGAGCPEQVVTVLLKASSIANDLASVTSMAKAAGVSVAVVEQAINIVRSINIGGLIVARLKPDSDPQTSQITSNLEKAAKPLKALIEGRYNELMTRYKSQLDNEGVIIVAFGGIRQQVDQFLKECNVETTRTAHAEALAAMDRVESGLRTDGQKSDWSELRKSLKDIFDTRKVATEKAFDDFFRANDGRFLGGLSTATEKALLEPDRWEVTINGVVAVGLDQKLRDWRQQVTVIQGGPKEAFDQIQNAFLGLPLGIREQVQTSINDYLGETMRTLNTEADKQVEVLEKCGLMVNAQKIGSDMDRGRLKQALRATIR